MLTIWTRRKTNCKFYKMWGVTECVSPHRQESSSCSFCMFLGFGESWIGDDEAVVLKTLFREKPTQILQNSTTKKALEKRSREERSKKRTKKITKKKVYPSSAPEISQETCGPSKSPNGPRGGRGPSSRAEEYPRTRERARKKEKRD